MVSDEGETTTSPVGTDLDDSSTSQASSQGDDGSDESYVMSGGSSEEGEDSGDTTPSESTLPAVLPDKVESNSHTATSAPLPGKINSNPTIKEEEASTDEEGYGDMNKGRKKRIKLEPQAKTEEVPMEMVEVEAGTSNDI